MTSMTAWVAAALVLSVACTKAAPKSEPTLTAGESADDAGSSGAGSGSGSGIGSETADERSRCHTVCRNYFTLAFWARWDPQIAAAPEAERPALREEKSLELEQGFARGIDQCIDSCVVADNAEQRQCIIDARTFAEAKICALPESEADSGSAGP